MITIKLVLIIVAAIFFAFDFFHVNIPYGNSNPPSRWTPGWTAGGFCLLTIALLIVK
jgi:hypothetical protein